MASLNTTQCTSITPTHGRCGCCSKQNAVLRYFDSDLNSNVCAPCGDLLQGAEYRLRQRGILPPADILALNRLEARPLK